MVGSQALPGGSIETLIARSAGSAGAALEAAAGGKPPLRPPRPPEPAAEGPALRPVEPVLACWGWAVPVMTVVPSWHAARDGGEGCP